MTNTLEIISTIIGFGYTISWSISFFPQIIENWERKSVVGLSFEFLGYNFTGHFAYMIFNTLLYWNKHILSIYYDDHPGSPRPVQINDVVFSLLAVSLTLWQIIQCFIYHRGKQKLSLIAIILIILQWILIVIMLTLSLTKILGWMIFLNFLGGIKIVATIIKYTPQAWMNYKRKSTIGWSIMNVILDFTGGCLSILQMIDSIDKKNWSDFKLGNLPKVGLGVLSIIFDLYFLMQHYIFYRTKITDKKRSFWERIFCCHKNKEKEERSSLIKSAEDEQKQNEIKMKN
ncbi:cystinosin [Anaeramoeba ignava]|uniref:Cystinosin n=1 Tax=Anaeramoeba ignava TaxID=1746090 RepID=A0A9Q0LUL0_ANAIG|nr:cystinosin [Anaeramoeba ignava]